MDAIECIKTRMSIRKFKPAPVPLDILMKVIEAAQWSPSYKNSQPWEVVIVSGEKKEALSKHLVELLEKNTPPCPDLPEPQSWPPVIDARITALMKKSSTERRTVCYFSRIRRLLPGLFSTWACLRRASCSQLTRMGLEPYLRHFSRIMPDM